MRAWRSTRAPLGMHAAGRIRPCAQEQVPFERAPEALTRLLLREAVGKLVVVQPAGTASL